MHKKIHETEHDNAGIEAAHKTEKAAETLGRYSVRKARENYRNQKLKPYRKARKAEKAAEKAEKAAEKVINGAVEVEKSEENTIEK